MLARHIGTGSSSESIGWARADCTRGARANAVLYAIQTRIRNATALAEKLRYWLDTRAAARDARHRASECAASGHDPCAVSSDQHRSPCLTKNSRNCPPTASTEKHVSTRRRARRLSSSLQCPSSSMRPTAAAKAFALPRGTTRPPESSPLSSMSGMPEASAAATGRPHAIASIGATGKPS